MGIDAEMFVRTMQPVTETDVREWAYRACACFGRERFIVLRPDELSYLPNGQRALEIVPVWEQDGPDIEPEPGETFIQVHLATRYYGVGYERGDLPTIVAIASWLEAVVPGASVWYGGDSSGVCAEPFGPQERQALLAHFASREGANYRHRDSEGRVCGFCDAAMSASRWGPNGTGYICLGCGLHELHGPDGVQRAEQGWPDEVCRSCRCARREPFAGRRIGDDYWHLDCWARAQLVKDGKPVGQRHGAPGTGTWSHARWCDLHGWHGHGYQCPEFMS